MVNEPKDPPFPGDAFVPNSRSLPTSAQFHLKSAEWNIDRLRSISVTRLSSASKQITEGLNSTTLSSVGAICHAICATTRIGSELAYT